MKHHLLAATALCACAAAHAQSSVTLYGIVDAWVGQTDTRTDGGDSQRVSRVESGGAQASRWGVRGEEDLGGGLRARFVLEQGISIDGGTISSVSESSDGFNRAAYLALSNPMGELRFGRMLTAYDALRGSMNQLYDSSGFASTGQVWKAGTTARGGIAAVKGSDYLARGNNTLYYRSPSVGPLVGSVSVSLGEGATTATKAPRMIAAHLEYQDGPVRVGYALQRERYTDGDNVFHLVGGVVQLGSVRLVGNLQRQIDERIAGHQKSNEGQFGVDMPIGQATVAVGYAFARTKNSSGRKVADADGFSAMATYDLSKRTRLYAAARRLSVDRADGSDASRETRYGVGVTHRF